MLFLRRSQRSSLLLSSAVLAIFGLASAAGATIVTAPASSVSGPPITGSITIDDGIDPGNLKITLTLDVSKGSVRGFFAQLADESLIPGLSVIGAQGFKFDANDIGKSKKARGLGQAGTACPCDMGVNFSNRNGTSVTFTLTHATQDLTVGLFYGQDFAIKASSIRLANATRGIGRGNDHGNGIKQALLEGQIPTPIPEPTTAMLMALGLAGLSYAGRARQD
jgi:hypothetical protein